MTDQPGPNHNHTTASKLAQLLGDVILHHAPHTARINETIKHEVKDVWLDRLEDHTTQLIKPMFERILAKDGTPDELKHILEQVLNPTAALGSFAQQFLVYGIGFSVAGAMVAPFVQSLTNELWKDFPERPTDLASLVAMAVRGIDPLSTDITDISGDLFELASELGYDEQKFQSIVDATGNPPSPQDLFEMVRRGIIDEDGLVSGLREGDTKNSWIDTFTKLRYTTPTPIDMVRAAVQAQLPYDEANQLATELGLEPANYLNGNPDWFKLLHDIAGRPPGPQEAGRMANRGIIPWTGTGSDSLSFEQVIAESDLKTKYTDVLQQLEVFYPTASEARTLYDAGGITLDQAKTYWKGNGLPTTLINAYSHQATIQQVQQERALAKGDILTALYDGIVTDAQALDLLEDVGFVGQQATYMIAITNMRREIREVNKAVSRVGTLYVAFKMTATDAKTSLSQLGISDAQADSLLNIWTIERHPQTRLPSIRELGLAVKSGGLPFDDAVNRAELLGYTKFDATVSISAYSQVEPPGGYPPQDNTGVQV